MTVQTSPAKWGGWSRSLVQRWTGLRWGLLCLLAACAVGSASLLYGSFVDEGDNLAVGQLLMHGRTLYRDVFSHHFPFTYGWLAVVFRLFGPSIVAARLSFLVFQLLAFAAAMYGSRLYVQVGLVALVWNCVSLFFYGTMVLYQTVGSLALLPLFALTFATVSRLSQPNGKQLFVASLFATAALLCNPLTLCPVGLALLFLAVRLPRKQIAVPVLTIAVGCGLCLAYLVATQSLMPFYQDVFIFNTTEYARYRSQGNVNFARLMLVTAATGFGIFDPKQAMFPIEQLSGYDVVSRAVLAGSTYKIIIIVLSSVLLLRRQFLAAAFIYLFTTTILLRGRTAFDNVALVLVGLFACVLLVTAAWPRGRQLEAGQRGTKAAGTWSARFRAGQSALRLGAGLLLVWMIGVGLHFMATHRAQLAYAANWEHYVQKAAHINALACTPETLLGYYPGDPYLYFFTDLKPVSKYLFLWPWVAEVGLQDVVDVLDNQPPAVVYFEDEGSVWGLPNTQYLSSLYTLLHTRYTEVENNIYLSAPTQAQCQPVARTVH